MTSKVSPIPPAGTSMLATLADPGVVHLVVLLVLLCIPAALTLLRLEWFARKSPAVRRDVIALREVELKARRGNLPRPAAPRRRRR